MGGRPEYCGESGVHGFETSALGGRFRSFGTWSARDAIAVLPAKGAQNIVQHSTVFIKEQLTSRSSAGVKLLQ